MKISEKALERAKKEKMYLWSIMLDGKHCNKQKIELTGALPEVCANELMLLIKLWVEKGYVS